MSVIKQIIIKILTSNHCLQPIILVSIGNKYAQIKHHLQVDKRFINKYVCGFWWKRTRGDGLFHGRKHYYGLGTRILARSQSLKLKCCNDGFVYYPRSLSLHKTLIDELEVCGLLVDYCDVFISCLVSRSDGTHSLQRIHWWTSDAMLNLAKSVPMKKQTNIYFRWTECKSIFILIL